MHSQSEVLPLSHITSPETLQYRQGDKATEKMQADRNWQRKRQTKCSDRQADRKRQIYTMTEKDLDRQTQQTEKARLADRIRQRDRQIETDKFSE